MSKIEGQLKDQSSIQAKKDRRNHLVRIQESKLRFIFMPVFEMHRTCQVRLCVKSHTLSSKIEHEIQRHRDRWDVRHRTQEAVGSTQDRTQDTGGRR